VAMPHPIPAVTDMNHRLRANRAKSNKQRLNTTDLLSNP
jgi:hypothetical protein